MTEVSHSWDAACAAAWDKWFHVIEAAAQPLSDRMAELAELAPGQRVLDIGTGLGEPAVTAARRVGPTGSVLAIDLSAEMLAYGRRRANALGLDQIDFREMNAERLDLGADRFDAALCRWGLMFVTDLAGVLAAVRRILVPGGRLVAAVWGPAEQVPAGSLCARVIRKHLDLPPPDEGARTPFSFADPESLLEALRTSGFKDVRGEPAPVTYRFESAERFTEFRQDRSSRLTRDIAGFPEADRTAAWRAVTNAARRYEIPDGSLEMSNEAYCAIGRR